MRIARALFILAALVPPASHGATPVRLSPIPGFVPNRGQAPAEALYSATIPGGALYLTRGAIVLDEWVAERTSPAEEEPVTRRVGRSVRVRFTGSNAAALVEAGGPGEARLNFIFGNDPAAWRTGVPVYASVVYRDLWPGIDLTFTSGADRIECSLDVGQGATAATARFELDEGDGASPVALDVAELAELLPGGADSGPRDDSNALLWSSYLGGSAEELGWSAAVDSHGNAIVTGLDTSTFFPTTPGAYDEVYSGLGDVFVSKLSADGSQLLWSTFVGGDSLYFDYGYAVTVDANDNPVVTGYTRNTNYPVTPGAYDTDHNGSADVFVTKLSADGSSLVWSTFLGGGDHDIGYDVALDPAGNPVVAGRALSFDFPTSSGAYDDSPNGEEDGFIAKLSAAGDRLQWCTMLGGSLYDGVQSVRLDAAGAPLVCGYTASFDFPGGSADGLYDIFLSKLSPTGTALTWSRLIGGSSYDYGTDLALDSKGNPVFCGSTGSFDFPVTAGAYDETYNGDDDVIVGKLQGTNGDVLWATFIGGTAPVYEIAHGVVMGAGDRPIVAGTTPSADFPTTPDGFDTSHNGAGDVFVLRLDASGTQLEWSSFFGGPGEDYAFELAKSLTGDVVVTGSVGDGFPVTAGAFDESYNGDISDVFVARIALASMGSRAPEDDSGSGPLALSVGPNPVAATTCVSLSLPAAAPAKLELFDVQGRRRAFLNGGTLQPGAHAFDWSALTRSAGPLPSGVYALRVTAGDRVESCRVVLLR